MTRTITVDHLARVEGHGGITVVLDGERRQQRRVRRFRRHPAVRGARTRRADSTDVTGIVSRICAICSHGHSITSLQAIENALGVAVTPQTRKLRDLAYQGRTSRATRCTSSASRCPTFWATRASSAWPDLHPDAVKTALRLKKLGNTIQEVVGGRAVHPVNYVIGGFGKLPSTDELAAAQGRARGRAGRTASKHWTCSQDVPVPDFCQRARSAVPRSVPDDEAFFFGNTVRLSTVGRRIPVADYREAHQRARRRSLARQAQPARRPLVHGRRAGAADPQRRPDRRTRAEGVGGAAASRSLPRTSWRTISPRRSS